MIEQDAHSRSVHPDAYISASFQRLLESVASQHVHELAELRLEVARLQENNEALQWQLNGENPPERNASNSHPPAHTVQEASEQCAPQPETGPLSPTKQISIDLLSNSDDEDEGGHVIAVTPYQKFEKFLQSDLLEIIIGVLILMNVLIMAFQLQYSGMEVGYDLRFPRMDRPADEIWPGASVTFDSLEYLFTALFTIDLVIRIVVLRRKFFRHCLNNVDLVVVTASLVELFNKGSVVDPAVIRLVRIVKLGRGLRMMQFSNIVESLQMLLRCLRASLSTLFWSLCLLFIIQCIGAMLIMSAVKPYLQDVTADRDIRILVFRYYGTFSRTILTMFEVLFANWAPSCRILVENVSEWFSLAFILYRCLIGFAVLNVVSAVFIQQTMKVAQQDRQFMIAQKEKSAASFVKRLADLFHKLDTSGDGQLSKEEFDHMVKDSNMREVMGHSDIEVQDMEALWNILDNGDGELSVDEFLMGVARIKGPSKSLDTVHVLHLCQRMEKKVDAFLEERKPAAARSPSVTLKPLPVVALLKEETCESMSI